MKEINIRFYHQKINNRYEVIKEVYCSDQVIPHYRVISSHTTPEEANEAIQNAFNALRYEQIDLRR